MAEKIDKLSLQSLYELIQTRSPIDHKHVIVGEIESAVSLGGIPAHKHVRNDLGAQTINSHSDDTSITVESEKSSIKLEAGRNKALLVVGDKQMSRHALQITGSYAEDVHVNINGTLNVNGYDVLTVNDAGKITGIDVDSLDLNGKGIIVSETEPINPSDGTIWAKVVEDDIETNVVDSEGLMKVLSLPVGTIIDWLGTIPPTGFIAADGGLYSRTIYSSLWDYAKVKTRLLDDYTWAAKKQTNNPVEYYSAGDSNTVFRVPYLPTGTSVTRIIKAYDEPAAQSLINLNALVNDVENAVAGRAITGVGYIKHANGQLIQFGKTTIAGDAAFSIPFANNNYQIFASVEDSTNASIAQVDTASKNAVKCNIKAYASTGARVYAIIDYFAIGSWS